MVVVRRNVRRKTRAWRSVSFSRSSIFTERGKHGVGGASSQELCFEFAVFPRVVRAVLRFSVIEAIGAATYSEDGGSLDAFGDSHARRGSTSARGPR